jgi:hypothetical protein
VVILVLLLLYYSLFELISLSLIILLLIIKGHCKSVAMRQYYDGIPDYE